MSTSVKNLSNFQVLLKRPAIAFGVIFIIAMIVAKPSYNLLPVLLGIILYKVLYQCRYYIYRMGLGRFDFLAILVYAPFVLSSMFNWEYHDVSAISVVWNKLHLWQFLTDSVYKHSILDLIYEKLDLLIHWKMVMFAPAVAGFLYLIFVEFDRRVVKDTDLQSLGLTDNDLFRRGGIVDFIAWALFLGVSVFYGLWTLIGAAVIIGLFNFVRPVWFAAIAVILAFGIVLFSYADFHYSMFLSMPTQFTTLVTGDRVWKAFVEMTNTMGKNNIGQWYILVPYLIFSGMVALLSSKHRVKVADVASEAAKELEIATTLDAVEFGFELSSRKPVRITHKELNTHMYINGASGSGKTVAMLNFVIDAAQKGIPLIYIDGKGATDLERNMADIAAKYNRVFKVFTLSPDAVSRASGYDFLGSGTFTEKKNRIMQLFITAEDAGSAYYQDNLEMFINRVFIVIERHNLKIDLFRFLRLIININDLIELAAEDKALENGISIPLKAYFEEIRDMKNDSPRNRIITKLDPFIHSSYGQLFDVIGKENVINIKQSIKNGEIVLFLFDASAFALDTARVAKMVISDINATFAEFGKEQKPMKTFCCFDEFKSYETEAIASTIALHRSNGMHAIIGTQSLALIDKGIGDAILTNCQTHFIMSSAEKDAERFANEFGTAQKIEATTRINAELQEVQDFTTRRIRDVVIDKQDIKDIRVSLGQGYLHRKAVGGKPVKIQVMKKMSSPK